MRAPERIAAAGGRGGVESLHGPGHGRGLGGLLRGVLGRALGRLGCGVGGVAPGPAFPRLGERPVERCTLRRLLGLSCLKPRHRRRDLAGEAVHLVLLRAQGLRLALELPGDAAQDEQPVQGLVGGNLRGEEGLRRVEAHPLGERQERCHGAGTGVELGLQRRPSPRQGIELRGGLVRVGLDGLQLRRRGDPGGRETAILGDGCIRRRGSLRGWRWCER